MPVVIEVVARIGDSVLDMAFLAPGATYRLGTAEIAVPASPSFTSSETRAGLVTIAMTRGFRIDTPIPLVRPDPRPVIYTLASLIAHLVVLLLALRFDALERLVARPEPPRYRYVHIPNEPEPEPEPEPDPAHRRREVARAAAKAAANRAAARAEAYPAANPAAKRRRTKGVPLTGETALASADEAIAGLIKSLDFVKPDMLDGVGPAYSEDDTNEKGFGGHRWDIDNDPDFASVKTPDGFDMSELAELGSLYGLEPAEKALRRIQIQTKLAHKSAIRGDCVPSHRIAKWLPRVDAALYKSIYLADPEIAYCLTQPVPPAVIKAEPYQRRHPT